jgi:hypothetical protein
MFVGGQEPDLDSPDQQQEFDRVQRELIEADRELDAAMERKRQARDQWLKLLGTDVGAVKDHTNQKRIVTFVNEPKVDKDTLLRILSDQGAQDAFSKSVTQEMVAMLRFRFDGRRNIDVLLRGLNRYAAQYKGYVDFDSTTHESIVDLDLLKLLCEKKGIPLPEEAFSDRYSVRIYPLDDPLPNTDPG